MSMNQAGMRTANIHGRGEPSRVLHSADDDDVPLGAQRVDAAVRFLRTNRPSRETHELRTGRKLKTLLSSG